jgi:hypothetical protein
VRILPRLRAVAAKSRRRRVLDLPRFYEVLVSGKAEFANGVRLAYPMEREAMRFLNLLGNKFFSLAFSWLLGQSIKDTLCGIKVLWRSDSERTAANRNFFGDLDRDHPA